MISPAFRLPATSKEGPLSTSELKISAGHDEVTERHDAAKTLGKGLRVRFQNEIFLDQRARIEHERLLFRMIDEDLLNPIAERAAPFEVRRGHPFGK